LSVNQIEIERTTNPISLLSCKWLSISSNNLFEIVKPKPVPPNFLVVELSSCEKALKFSFGFPLNTYSGIEYGKTDCGLRISGFKY
jgi:hypothetical protein